MKSEWNKLCESLANYGDLIKKTFDIFPPTKQAAKVKKMLAKEWDVIIKTVDHIDKMIDPVNPPEILLPFHSERFKAMWLYYKDYLQNNHGMVLTAWNEQSRLTMLKRFSRGDEERAMLILELMCANNYRNIICPGDKQIAGEESMPVETPAVSNLLINVHEEF